LVFSGERDGWLVRCREQPASWAFCWFAYGDICVTPPHPFPVLLPFIAAPVLMLLLRVRRFCSRHQRAVLRFGLVWRRRGGFCAACLNASADVESRQRARRLLRAARCSVPLAFAKHPSFSLSRTTSDITRGGDSVNMPSFSRFAGSLPSPPAWNGDRWRTPSPSLPLCRCR